jgi:hypothetical protein
MLTIFLYSWGEEEQSKILHTGSKSVAKKETLCETKIGCSSDRGHHRDDVGDARRGR